MVELWCFRRGTGSRSTCLACSKVLVFRAAKYIRVTVHLLSFCVCDCDYKDATLLTHTIVLK